MDSEIGTLPTPSTYTRLLLQRWVSRADDLLAGSGLNEQSLASQATITVDQQLHVFRNARELAARADWALQFGQQLSISSHGPLGFAALSAPTLGEGLDVFGRFGRIRAPYLDFAIVETDQQLRMIIGTSRYPLGDLAPATLEIVFLVAMSFIDAVIGRHTVDVRLYRSGPPPAHAVCYPDYFAARCEFNASFDGLALPVSLRALPCPLHDEKTYAASLARCREALDAILSPDDVVTRASHWLAAHFDQIVARGSGRGLPRLDALAAALCVSPRTLNRQLALQGTRFSELRATFELEAARKLLADARFTANDVAVRLGYGDAANFGRAFRRMTGQSPGQYRRGQH